MTDPNTYDETIAQLAWHIEQYQTSAVAIQELFEKAIPVGAQVTTMRRGQVMEVEIVKHQSHKRKTQVLVRDTYSGVMFETDMHQLFVPGLPAHLSKVEPPELPEPPAHCEVRHAEEHGIQLPTNCDVTEAEVKAAREQIEAKSGRWRRPARHGAKPKYPFWALLPGDTFYTEEVAPAKLRSAAGQLNRRTKAQYAVRAEPPGVRVYRLK